MLHLIRYEFRKARTAGLILSGIATLLEVVFIIALLISREDLISLSAGLLCILTVGGLLMLGVQSIVTLHRDMNSKQGYMLFMTPNSSYRILGAKVIECASGILLAGIAFFALGVLDITLVFRHYGQLEMLVRLFRDMISSVSGNIDLSLSSLAAFSFSAVSSWLCTILTAFLSDVVSSSLLNGKKGNGWITFLLFIALNILLAFLDRLIPQTLSAVLLFVFDGVLGIVLSCVMYFLTARIMEKYLSV